jgi:hypothetical protein
VRNRIVWSQHCIAALSHETGCDCLFLQFSIGNKSHQGNHPMLSCPYRLLCSTWNGASRNPYASFSHWCLTAGMWITIKTRNFKLRRAEMPGNVAHSLTGDLAKHGIFGSSEQNTFVLLSNRWLDDSSASQLWHSLWPLIDPSAHWSDRCMLTIAQPSLISPLWSYCLRNRFQAPLPTCVQPLY